MIEVYVIGSLSLHITQPWKLLMWTKYNRYPVLAGLLSNIPGYIEQIGSGIRFMLDETKRMELPAPQFREMSEFIVTFQKAPALQALEPRVQYKGGTLWEEHEDSPPERVVQDRRAEQVEKRLSQALKYVKAHG